MTTGCWESSLLRVPALVSVLVSSLPHLLNGLIHRSSPHPLIYSPNLISTNNFCSVLFIQGTEGFWFTLSPQYFTQQRWMC